MSPKGDPLLRTPAGDAASGTVHPAAQPGGSRSTMAVVRIHLWQDGLGWIIYMRGVFRALPNLEGLATVQRAVLSPYTNVSSVTGPLHDVDALDAAEAAATGVAYTYESTEGKQRLAAVAQQYEPLIADVLAEIESADRAGDVAASAAAHDALRQLKRLMAADLKKEKESQETELMLALHAETKRVLRAISAIESVFPWVGAHLRKRIVRGFEVTYEPRPDELIKWFGFAPPVAEG